MAEQVAAVLVQEEGATMKKRGLIALSMVTFVLGLIWVDTYHLTGMAAAVVIGLPLILGMLSAKFGL